VQALWLKTAFILYMKLGLQKNCKKNAFCFTHVYKVVAGDRGETGENETALVCFQLVTYYFIFFAAADFLQVSRYQEILWQPRFCPPGAFIK